MGITKDAETDSALLSQILLAGGSLRKLKVTIEKMKTANFIFNPDKLLAGIEAYQLNPSKKYYKMSELMDYKH